MSEQRSSLEPFCLGPAESVGPRWERWFARFENYLVAANITAEARKKAQLLHLAGEDVFDVFSSLPASPASYSDTKAALSAHFNPKRNKEFEVFRFRSTRQTTTETIDEFAVRLRRLAKHCEFGDVDWEIKSQIVQTCVLEKVREKAFMETVTLEGLLAYARTVEAAQAHMAAMAPANLDSSVLPAATASSSSTTVNAVSGA